MLLAAVISICFCLPLTLHAGTVSLKVGAAAIAITPYGPNPDWHGPITANGIWGERFTDANQNDRWDAVESVLPEAFPIKPSDDPEVLPWRLGSECQ
jgi:hypothetical protein